MLLRGKIALFLAIEVQPGSPEDNPFSMNFRRKVGTSPSVLKQAGSKPFIYPLLHDEPKVLYMR